MLRCYVDCVTFICFDKFEKEMPLSFNPLRICLRGVTVLLVGVFRSHVWLASLRVKAQVSDSHMSGVDRLLV